MVQRCGWCPCSRARTRTSPTCRPIVVQGRYRSTSPRAAISERATLPPRIASASIAPAPARQTCPAFYCTRSAHRAPRGHAARHAGRHASAPQRDRATAGGCLSRRPNVGDGASTMGHAGRVRRVAGGVVPPAAVGVRGVQRSRSASCCACCRSCTITGRGAWRSGTRTESWGATSCRSTGMSGSLHRMHAPRPHVRRRVTAVILLRRMRGGTNRRRTCRHPGDGVRRPAPRPPAAGARVGGEELAVCAAASATGAAVRPAARAHALSTSVCRSGREVS